jgi:hypothetical protein
MPKSLAPHAAAASRDWAELSIALMAGLGLAITALFFCAVPLAGHMAASRDFISYWSAGRQLARHANPYDRTAVGTLEHAMGLEVRGVLVMRNPPWALPLAYPLGFLGLRVAAVLWSLLLLGSLIVSVAIVHRLHGSPPNHIHWLGLAFTPALICFAMGQTSLFALLGLALFLRDHTRRPFAAGAALWFCALKPHLFLPFGIALLAWIAFTGAWKVLAGATAALGFTTALGFLLAPHAWSDYIAMLRSPLVAGEFVPCLGDAFRHWLFPAHHWTQYLLAAGACLWALVYYLFRRRTWNWVHNASPLMLVSLAAAPYCFLYDQGLAIPALMDAAYSTRRRALLIVLVALIVLLDIQLCFAKITSVVYLWTAPVWLAWYLVAVKGRE